MSIPSATELARVTAIDQRDDLLRLGTYQLFTRSWTPSAPEASRRAPILLFHDSLGCVELWRSFPERLAAATGRRVVAYDRLGFGRSDPHPGKLGIGFVADEADSTVPQLCDRLGIGDFVACGHSVGGGMAIEAAARWPERCRALVTIAAQTFIEDRTLAGIRVAQRDFQDPDNLARLARYHGDRTPWVLDAWIGTWLSPAFADWNLDQPLAGVRCPVLAVHGELDEYGSLRHPRRIAQGRGEALILPGIGHVPHREAEGALVTAIAGFLAVAPAEG
jgi:pimeloyl-ACP methyl ester carboxylesterase